MVVFALSCFGLLLFLWLAFGGAIPLKPKGYRFQTSFAEAAQLAKEADVRISGVPVGKVKTIEPDKATGRATSTIEIEPRYAPLPRDARAILRQKTLLGETYVELTPGTEAAKPIAEDGDAARRPGLADRGARRDPARVRPADARGVPDLDAGAGAGHRRLRARHQRRARQPAPFAEDTAQLVDILNTQQGAVQRLDLQHRRGLRRAEGARRPAALADRQLQPVFATTAARDRELQEAFVALPTFEDESRETRRRA